MQLVDITDFLQHLQLLATPIRKHCQCSMSKRVSRPWDRNGIGRHDLQSSSVPSVIVDGVEYLSDRFYLNRGVGDPPVTPTNECTCGARSPPPLLDRGRLVASLKVKAAIVASYTLDPSHMIREYPSLFGPDNNVPTLVLHGHMGLSDRLKQKKKTPMSQQSESQSSAGHSEEWNDSRYQQDTKRARVDITAERNNDDDGVICIDDSSDEDEPSSREKVKTEYQDEEQVAIKEEEPPEDAWLRKQNATIVSAKPHFGKSVHLTEILTTWLPDNAKDEIESLRKERATKDEDDEVVVLDSDDEETPADTRYGVEEFVIKRRLGKRGVHHPKFMILFETCGSVVVIVTTANLTPQHAVDASWVQRFEPLQTTNARGVTDSTQCDGSDFGYVLANYLECQQLAARAGEMIPEVFLRRYLALSTLDDLQRRYNWNSQAHLIATVPGNYKGSQSVTHLGMRGTKRTFLYGSQRVNDILRRLSESPSTYGEVSLTRPWVPKAFLSDDDRLIIQPTSFGGLWKQESICELIRLYYDYGKKNATATSPGRAHQLLKQTDIVWPTLEYMAEVNHRRKKNNPRVPSPDSVASIEPETAGAVSSDSDGSFVFLSSISFNTIDFFCISRMCMFEPSYPSQTPSNRSPHIKSFSRVFEGDEYQLRKHFNLEKAEEFLSWCMLTSACLSRGAQGEANPSRAFDSDEMTYSNFELGVLFVSRLQGDKNSDRLYCSKPSRCHCGQIYRASQKQSVQMIHLPLPYRLRSRPYHDDEDESEMCATPYFHEIPQGTGFVGQMRLTPLGMQLAAAQL